MRQAIVIDFRLGDRLEVMRQLPAESIHLIVTSPPYNVGKHYNEHDDLMEMEDYLRFLYQTWEECKRVLAPGGRIAINVANTDRKPYIPLNTLVVKQMLDLGFLMRGEIIWNKGASAGVSCAWGSFGKASNPVLRDIHEYIEVFSKDAYALQYAGDSGIQNQEFVAWTKSIWDMRTESRRKHVAPFPVELPYRLILLYSNRGDRVLDPFSGSGTTGLACAQAGRNFVGIDNDPQSHDEAQERVRRYFEGLIPRVVPVRHKSQTEIAA